MDCVYSNIGGAYKALPWPHLGFSDHISVPLVLAYRPLLRQKGPIAKIVLVWPSDRVSTRLCTDWQVFREAATYEGDVDLE